MEAPTTSEETPQVRSEWNPKRLVKLAEQVAREAHAGQVDKAGQPYWRHLQRVAERVRWSPWDAAVAWLHDTLEDTASTPATLEAAGVPSTLVRTVELLTRPEGMSYEVFIERILRADLDDVDSRARRVKIADLLDNLDPDRGYDNPGLRRRYTKALDRLLHAESSERSDELGGTQGV